MKKFFLAGLFALTSLTLSNPARAAFVFTVTEVGNDVQLSGSGTIDLDDLTAFTSGTTDGIYANPAQGIISGGQDGFDATLYSGLSGPVSLGSGEDNMFADLAAGDYVIVAGSFAALGVNTGYVSGTFLSNSATFENQSFASLGLTPGTYVYTWGSGENADSLTVNVVGVPEPATAGLFVLGGCAVLFRSRRRS